MFKYKDKKYTNIFWDWLWTLYSPQTDSLFPWVEKFFSDHSDDVQHFLFSYSSDPPERLKFIKSFDISGHFLEMYVDGLQKKEHFLDVINKYNLDQQSILVIGDNPNDELVSAEELGLDHDHIDEFVKNSF